MSNNIEKKKNSDDILDINPDLLDNIFGGIAQIDGQQRLVTPLTPKCHDYMQGDNGYFAMTIVDTCGRCHFFQYRNGIGRCTKSQ